MRAAQAVGKRWNAEWSLQRRLVFITHLHSSFGVGANKGVGQKFRVMHLITDISVDLERV